MGYLLVLCLFIVPFSVINSSWVLFGAEKIDEQYCGCDSDFWVMSKMQQNPN